MMELKRHVADLKSTPFAQVGFKHANAIENGAIAAAHIADTNAIRIGTQLAMKSRDGGGVDHEVVAGVRPDRTPLRIPRPTPTVLRCSDLL